MEFEPAKVSICQNTCLTNFTNKYYFLKIVTFFIIFIPKEKSWHKLQLLHII